MKKRIVLILLVVGATLFSMNTYAQAQDVQREVTKKELRQRARIAEGRQSGELTKREARKLRKQQRHIHRKKKAAAADGVITPAEKHDIDKSQRRANRNIARKKHNGRSR